MKRQGLLEKLKGRIINGDYKPGVALNEKEICKEFRISRTPYREAMFQLQADGLVQISHKKGIFVAPLDLNSIKDIFEMRRILESVAARMAFKRITPKQIEDLRRIVERVESLSPENDFDEYLKLDEEFHNVILAAQGNGVLDGFLSNLRHQCMRSWNSIEDQSNIRVVTVSSIRNLRKIYDAFVNKDSIVMEELINEHFAVYLKTIAAHLLEGLGAELSRDMKIV